MRLPNRSRNDHGTLVLLELLAVPVAILAAFFTLALAKGGFVLVHVVSDAVDGGGLVLDLGTTAIAVGTLMVLVAGGGVLVDGYRHYFETRFETVAALPVVLVPVIGIVGPIGYALWETGSLQLSPWQYLPLVISAYALAYRTIAIDSLRTDRGWNEFAVGALTAIPLVGALVAFTSGMVDPELPVARALEAVVTAVPMERVVLVAVPLLVTALYGVATLSDLQFRRPDWLLPEPRNPFSGLLSRDGTETAGQGHATAGASPSSAELARSSDRSVATADSSASTRSTGPNVVVPSSPGSTSARADSSSADADGGADSRATAGSKSTDDSSASSESTEPAERSAKPARDERSDGETQGASEMHRDDGGDGGVPVENTTSDTRIFVDDFGQYAPDGTAGETCPDCEEEIPSDGVYMFCPFCGTEL